MKALGIMLQRLQRNRLRRVLLEFSDRKLADMGFDRARVEQGVSAWPWRQIDDDVVDYSAWSQPGVMSRLHPLDKAQDDDKRAAASTAESIECDRAA